MSAPVDPILTAIDARMAALQQLRAHVVEVLGLLGPLPAPEMSPAPRETKAPRRASTRLARGTKPPKGETPARPTRAPSGTAQRILAALKAGPQSSTALAAQVGITSAGVCYQAKRLVSAGQVIREGASNATRYRLA